MEFYSQWGQDKYIYNNFFKNKKDGFFLEIGADDGVRFSNCKFFEDNFEPQRRPHGSELQREMSTDDAALFIQSRIASF